MASSAVVLTEYRHPEKILGLLRTSVPDASGRVPVERHYWDLGLGQEGSHSRTQIRMVRGSGLRAAD
ncbi:MAG: hypothetical protein R3B54_10405 [Bdellovibrionota bacterium]